MRGASCCGAERRVWGENGVDINLSPAAGLPPLSTTRRAGMHGEYLWWCGPDKTHIVLVGHGWCESPLPRVVTETSAQQPNVEEINRWWPVMAAQACQDTQDVKVTNDDEEKGNWSDDDEAHKGNGVQFSNVCASCLKLEVIRIYGRPLLGFFGHESCLTHPVHSSPTPACFTVVSTWDLVTQHQTLIINIKRMHAIYLLVLQTLF